MRAMPTAVEKHCIWMAALDAHVLDDIDGIEIIRAIMFESYRLQKFQLRYHTLEMESCN